MVKTLREIMGHGSFKIVDIESLGDSTLGVEKLGQFIRVVREETTILNEATYKRITKDQYDIDLIDMARGVLTPGRDNTGAKRIVPPEDEAAIETITNSLIPKEYIAKVNIDIESIEDNIEQDAFESLVVELLAKACAQDIEASLLFADSSAVEWGTSNESKLLSMNDGWVKLAGNKIYGGDGSDFDPEADNYPINMFDAMIKAMPKRFIRDRSNYRFYVPFDEEDYFANIIAARGTVIGDNALLGKDVLTYKKIPIINAPVLDFEEYTDVVGTPAMLTKPKNMYWGTKREVTVKSQEDIEWRRIKNVLSTRMDSHYEETRASVVSFVDKENPE